MRLFAIFGLVLAFGTAHAATWETTLEARDVTGDGVADAYYDTVLDITWLADANLPASNTFGVSGISTDPAEIGRADWDTALEYMVAMNDAAYLGVNEWRLPTMTDIDNDGCVDRFSYVGADCGYNVAPRTGPDASEMASMFYDTLGNLAFFDETGTPGQIGIQNTGPFENLGDTLYWTNLELITDSAQAWYFGMPSGGQGPRLKDNLNTLWPVLDGDYFAAVPLPAGVWLFSSALGLLVASRRRLASSSSNQEA